MNTEDIGKLPDYAALRQIQDALWRIGEVHGAAVMIGAGFSRFADRAAETTPLAPLWNDFRDEMRGMLYPSGGGTIDPLALAEEYRASLGELALDKLIRGRIRDTEWEPGALHRRLLHLPWSDVLTTNWDTLLERSAELDPDYSYSIVRVVSDIARTRSPRIVKLHGSFPSYGPFIFSEEDFRTYPKKFAPFVNLAQQVLLENELCLLGFSGDDPNFLEWAGWVRDQLGTAARPIRLVGVLDLSPSRRRLLEKRNITPIDLAPLVRDTPAEDRHRQATELFLEALWQARPKSKAEWNFTPESQYGLDKLSDPTSRIERLTEIWARDRKAHPGWLVTPSYVRDLIQYNTQTSIQVLIADIDKVPTLAKVAVLYEIVWRWTTAFCFLPDFIEKAVADALATGEDASLSLEHRVFLHAATVRTARHRRDWPAFEIRIKRLQELDTREAQSEAIYESCLRARDELNYEFIVAHSGGVAGYDPVWLLRRAALLTEVLETRAAAYAVRDAYQEIRRRRVQDRLGVWLLSREAWASWLMDSARFELGKMRDGEKGPDWPLAYKAAETDPWDEIQRIDRSINEAEDTYRKAGRDRVSLFDAGAYRISVTGFLHQGNSKPYDSVSFLNDYAGIPIRLGLTDLQGSRFSRAVNVARDESVSGIWNALRGNIYHDNENINHRFGRIDVARMPFELIKDMTHKLRGAIEFGWARIIEIKDDGAVSYNSDWANRNRALLELLSRLSVRFAGDDAIEVFRFGVSLFKDARTAHWWLLEGIENLIRRSLQALEPARRAEVALDVLYLPLASENIRLSEERRFPELSDCLSGRDWKQRKYNHEWSSRIAFLINAVAENVHKKSREQAAFRLLQLFVAGSLSDVEAVAFGSALWKHTDKDGLPNDTNILPHVFLDVHCADSELPQRVFKISVIKKLSSGLFTEDRLLALLGASYTLQGKYRLYALDPGDALDILDHALKWKPKVKGNRYGPIGGSEKDDEISYAMGRALAATVVPSLTRDLIGIDRFKAVFERISDGSLPSLLVILPGLVELDPSLSDDADRVIRNSLLKGDPGVVAAALTAIFWLVRFSKQKGRSISPMIATELVSLCLIRREPHLISALSAVSSLVAVGAVTIDDRKRLIDVLKLIRAETAYESWLDETRRSDVGLIRAGALKLAAALRKAGTNATVIDEWIAQSSTDPMPEARYALEGLGADD